MDDNPFAPVEPAAPMVWLNHCGGVPAAFPAAAVDAWVALGWQPCDPPVEVDPATVELVPPDPEPAPPAEHVTDTAKEEVIDGD